MARGYMAVAVIGLSMIGGAAVMSVTAGGPPPEADSSPAWVMGDEVMVLVARDGTAIAGYSQRLGSWTWQGFDGPPAGELYPIVSSRVAAVRVGDRVYAYSAVTNSWDVARIDGKEQPTVHDDGVMLISGDLVYLFSGATGRWTAADAKAKTVVDPPER